MTAQINYYAVPTAQKFHADNSFVRGVLGPVRSSKSTMCSVELLRRSMQQKPGSDGIRRTRWAIIRNTYRELLDTTLKTWLDWVPEWKFGAFNKHDMTHRIRVNDIDADFLFRALDRPSDIRKLLSMELTGGWVNEAREIVKPVIDTLIDRIGQYPAKKDGGPSWFGLIMDTNPPDDQHWWYDLAEKRSPEERPGWTFYRQPGALVERDGKFLPNPAAENIHNLNEGTEYYLRRLIGKGKDYVRVYYCAQYGFVIEGKPVHPDYTDHLHCPGIYFEPSPRYPILVGMDFGLTPAAAFLQKQLFGSWIAFDELVATDMGAKNFARTLKRHINQYYPNFKFEFYGDPAGDDRAQTDESTVYQILSSEGISANPVFTNDPTVRREALAEVLRRIEGGKPAFLLSPKCVVLRKGLNGGFCYKQKNIMTKPGAELYHEKPDKNIYSHIVEACEYGMLGGGEGAKVIEGTTPPDMVYQQSYLDGYRDNYGI